MFRLLRPRGWVRSIVMSMSVCLSVRSHNSKTTWPNFTKFPCTLPRPITVVRFSSSDVAISFVLPILWMTSCFHMTAQLCVMCISKRRQNHVKHNSRHSNQTLLNDNDQQVFIVSCARGGERNLLSTVALLCLQFQLSSTH